ncbi:MAG: TetR family transcriptional regulator [Desulfobacteraceae bacterium]|nr:TetR family transcriptional regulator [Desulfobacteraceae bacterium]
MARPALSEEERSSRRGALLEAAERLYRERKRLPTVLDIARAAGMAKGAVYLWFRSKEEIFVALLEANFVTLITRLLPVIGSLDPHPALAAGMFAARYLDLLDGVPDILPLSSVPNNIFNEHLPIESLSRLNRNLGAGLSKAGALLERRVGNLQPGQGAALLLRTWTLTVGMWLTLNMPEDLRRILDAPALSIFRRRFREELEIAVTQLWRGALIGI